MIERGRRGEREGRVMTQPAKISLIRDTDNPWYEVVLTEGKNREIRKMFEEVGPFCREGQAGWLWTPGSRRAPGGNARAE